MIRIALKYLWHKLQLDWINIQIAFTNLRIKLGL